MPYKYPKSKDWRVPKQRYRVSNWFEYNAFLRRRGDIDFWLDEKLIGNWYEQEQVYDGTGTPKKYSDLAIIICHELRKVFRLPLRQTEGFLNSVFRNKGLDIRCPDYTTLSKCLSSLSIKCPCYKKTERPDDDLVAIAVDSTGLKCFGKDEWHQKKHKVAAKRSWRKLHLFVDDKHYIQGAEITDLLTHDASVVDNLAQQVSIRVEHSSADGAYDKNPVYSTLSHHFPDAEIIIPPQKNARLRTDNHQQRNRNIIFIRTHGRMHWQHHFHYGKRNYSELSIQRYKRILGNALQSRELSRQKNEGMIGCGVLNKMTSIGMPKSYRVA